MPAKNWYTVYQAENDEIIAIGTAKECATGLNFSEKTFYEMIAKVKIGRSKRYIIAIEELDDSQSEDDEDISNVKIYGEDNFGYKGNKKHDLDEGYMKYLYDIKYTDNMIAEKCGLRLGYVAKWRRKNHLPSNGYHHKGGKHK